MKKDLGVIGTIIAAGIVTVLVWGGIDMIHERSIAEQERYTYTGKVTAIVNGDYWTTVWLNSTPQTIRILSSRLQLAVGEEYQIILDGNGNLINAIILPREEK